MYFREHEKTKTLMDIVVVCVFRRTERRFRVRLLEVVPKSQCSEKVLGQRFAGKGRDDTGSVFIGVTLIKRVQERCYFFAGY